MKLAPTYEFHSALVQVPDGLPGAFFTVSVMRELVTRYKINPDVRQTAISIIFLTPERDQYAEALALFEYVRDHVRYVQDIAGVETIASPDKVLCAQVGDCDDQSVLLAAMLESVGYITRFVVAGYNNRETVEHVYLQVLLNGEWIDADPTEHAPLGYSPPGAVVLYAETV